MLRPSNSSSQVLRIPHALIGATHLIASCHVVLALKAHCHAVEVVLAGSIPLFLIEFVTAWSGTDIFLKACFPQICDELFIDWPCFIGIYPWTYHYKVIQQLSGTARKFSETGLFEYQAYIELYLSRNQDLLLGATFTFRKSLYEDYF